MYVVDVAVVKPNKIPRAKGRTPWVCLDNSNLVTFVEVKKLVVYPMLLAQFIGIVHEIKPKLLQGSAYGFKKYNHYCPALISIGYLKGTSSKVLVGFGRRNYKVCVVHSFDTHLSSMRAGTVTASPFEIKARMI